jgi:hypothetical protein
VDMLFLYGPKVIWAWLGGAMCGVAFLVQLLLRDAVGTSLPGASVSLTRLMLGARLLAAAVSLILLFIVVPRYTPTSGGSDLELWLVFFGVVSTILIGLRQTKLLAHKVRRHLLQ